MWQNVYEMVFFIPVTFNEREKEMPWTKEKGKNYR